MVDWRGGRYYYSLVTSTLNIEVGGPTLELMDRPKTPSQQLRLGECQSHPTSPSDSVSISTSGPDRRRNCNGNIQGKEY